MPKQGEKYQKKRRLHTRTFEIPIEKKWAKKKNNCAICIKSSKKNVQNIKKKMGH